MKGKRIVALILVLLLVSSLVPVYATDGETGPPDGHIIRPMFTNINLFYNELDISESGKATVYSQLWARNCDESRISAYLQQYSNGQWITIRSWSTSRQGTSVLLEESWYVLSGYKYRLVSYAYVYGNGVLLESDSYTSEPKSY